MQNFLVRGVDPLLKVSQFLEAWDKESEPEWVDVPSIAAHFTYEDADEKCQDLQELGWVCWVVNIYGEPATAKVIRESRESQADAVEI